MKKKSKTPEELKPLIDDIKSTFGIIDGMRRKTLTQIYNLGQKLDQLQNDAPSRTFNSIIKENGWNHSTCYDYMKLYTEATIRAGKLSPVDFLATFKSYEHAKKTLFARYQKNKDTPGVPHLNIDSLGNSDKECGTPFDVKTPDILERLAPPHPIGVTDVDSEACDLPDVQRIEISKIVGQFISFIQGYKVGSDERIGALKSLYRLNMEIEVLGQQLTDDMVAA